MTSTRWPAALAAILLPLGGASLVSSCAAGRAGTAGAGPPPCPQAPVDASAEAYYHFAAAQLHAGRPLRKPRRASPGHPARSQDRGALGPARSVAGARQRAGRGHRGGAEGGGAGARQPGHPPTLADLDGSASCRGRAELERRSRCPRRRRTRTWRSPSNTSSRRPTTRPASSSCAWSRGVPAWPRAHYCSGESPSRPRRGTRPLFGSSAPWSWTPTRTARGRR